ncbi:MAG: hypothetical protein HBSAPP03_24020 [Phycisphaerae bacterium]|nr:MAG: hypothetical protein HBSAPP03_24020 [Phycisphaerae bacterium]
MGAPNDGRFPATWLRRRLIARSVNAIARLHPALTEARLIETIARRMPAALARIGARGAQFAISVGDRPIRGLAFDAPAELPFRVASIAKPWSAMLALRLAHQGRLDLDEPVGYVLSDMPPAWRLNEITPRLLLSHTAGFADRIGAWLPVGTVADASGVLRGDHGKEYAAEAVHPPGQVTCYTSIGFTVLQLALERRFGVPFAVLMRRELLDPLALCDSGFEPFPSHPLGEEIASDGRPVAPTWTPCAASSGLWTTALDMARFGRAVLASASGKSGWIEPALARQMLIPSVSGPDGGAFALGLHVVQDPRVWCLSHGGDRPGLRAQVLIFPNFDLVFAAIVLSEAGRKVIRPLWDLMTWLAVPRGGRPA